MSSLYEKLRRIVDEARLGDPDLERELADLTDQGVIDEIASGLKERMQDLVEGVDDLAQVAAEVRLVRPNLNPVFDTVGDKLVLTFPDAESGVWKERLEAAGESLASAALAVGCFEVVGRVNRNDGGTGVMVAPDILVTNSHVAETFAFRQGDILRFSPGEGGGTMKPFIDFIDTPTDTLNSEFEITRVLHMQEDRNPDIALLRVKSVDGNRKPLPTHLQLADEVVTGREVAAIGYPQAEDNDALKADIERVFKGVFDRKRVAPGRLGVLENGVVKHDCSVLTGNSGSPLVDLETGKVVGIHFKGAFTQPGLAVSASLIATALQKLEEADDAFRMIDGADVESASGTATSTPSSSGVSITIPINITVSLGTPVVHRGADVPG
jgi:hypothetical protein